MARAKLGPMALLLTAGSGYGIGKVLEHRGDVRVLKVKGDFHEMGRQHGALLADDVRRGPIPYYRETVERIVARSFLGKASPLVWPLVQRALGRRVEQAMPSFVLETVRGLAEGAGMDERELLDGCTMPDSFVWLVGRMMRHGGAGPAVAHRLALELGCTSALAWGDATRDGRMLHARNFDYHGVGCWPETKTVIFHEPDEGLRYASVAAAGVALGGITAMNEAGLTLTVHQHMFTDRSALGGTPIGVVGDRVMREAKNLDDALRILESHRPIGCWTYVIADGHRREALCFEENPERRAPRILGRDDGATTFGYANIYLDEELGATEVNGYGSYWRHNMGRHRRVNALLEERAGELDPQAMGEILGHPGDPACRLRDSIAMVMTVGSVVFRPDDGTLWVGTGVAPTSHGAYLALNLFDPDFRAADGTPGVEVVGEPEAGRRAFEHYRRAYLAYVDEGALDDAARAVDAAREAAPEQALYHFLAGLLAIEGGRPREAEVAFDRALALGHPDVERVASFHLWRGRARDLLGRRREAERDYRTCLGHYADAPVHRAARKGLRRRFTKRKAARMHVDMSLADVITP